MSGKIGVHNPFRKWKKGDFLANPHLNLVLNEFGRDKDGTIFLSANLMTEEEIDWAVKSLIQDAQKAGKAAKLALRAQIEKMRA